MAFGLQLRKVTKTSELPKSARFISAGRESFSRLGHRLEMASTDLRVNIAHIFSILKECDSLAAFLHLSDEDNARSA
jgi:hypothetical protein